MREERGAAAVLGMAVASLLVIVAIATAGVGILYGARAQAITAADAAALAAAVATYPPASPGEPGALASLAAKANGATLEGCDCRIDTSLRARTVHVVVSLEVQLPVLGPQRVRSRASAEFDPSAWLGRPG